MRALITGATGFVGSHLVPLLAQSYEEIVVIVRPQSLTRAQGLWSHLPNIRFVSGDILNPGLVSDPSQKPQAFNALTDVIHLAANYDLTGGADAAYLHNVVGTQNVLDFVQAHPSVKRLHHISTIAISGDFGGVMKESMFNVGQHFKNPYAQTKYRAEGLVGSWKNSEVKRYVYRLGVVVGHSETGYISKSDGPYYLFDSLQAHQKLWRSLLSFGKILMPFDPEARIPMIPVDVLAKSLAEMMSQPKDISGNYRTYHVVGAHVMVRPLLERAFSEFGHNEPLVSIPRFLTPKPLLDKLDIPSSLVDYMYSKTIYDVSHVTNDFPNIAWPSFDEYGQALFRFVKEGVR